MGQYPKTEQSIKNIRDEVGKMCNAYVSLCGHLPEFSDVDRMLMSVVDRIENADTRALCRSISILGLTRTDTHKVNVILSFPSKFITSFEYRKPGEKN